MVKVRRHYLIAHPSWDTDLHGKLSCCILIDIHGDIAIPWILCGLTEGNLLSCYTQVTLVGEEEVHIDIMVFYCIDISRQRGNESADVRRATSTAKPCLTLVLTHRLQGVGVEETIALK